MCSLLLEIVVASSPLRGAVDRWAEQLNLSPYGQILQDKDNDGARRS